MLILGRRFLKEFTHPGVTVEQGTPQYGGRTFPALASEPPPMNCSESTIILSHGFHFPSVHFHSVAAIEYAHGANILLFDYRGHGQSVLIPTTCGNAEVNNLLAAVEVATSQPETSPGQVYIHGFSMGSRSSDFAATTCGHCRHHRR
jgi:alpha-beta hydrolase superfamily lysophospholipase